MTCTIIILALLVYQSAGVVYTTPAKVQRLKILLLGV